MSPVLFLALVVSPVSAQTTADLQAQITALLQQVQALQVQLQASSTSSTFLAEETIALTFNLRRGSTDAATNGEVSKLQQFLAKDPAIYPEALVTGYFGPLTEAAVKRWQAKNAIETVGVVGPKTRAVIKRVSTPPPATPLPATTTPLPAPTSTAPAPPLPPPATPPPAGGLGSITLSPSSGMVRDTVTITGSGFTATGNDLHFGGGGVKNINSFNSGNMITFEVPNEVSACDLVIAGAVICSDPDVQVTPGTYIVYVTNADGATATTTFTVTSGTSYPAIVTVSPNVAKVGDVITITGSGLDLTDNEVHLGVGGVRVNTQRKVKGTLLDFTVPATVNDCDFSTGLPPCTGKSYQIVPGYYALYIVNSSGKTNSVTFTVTSY